MSDTIYQVRLQKLQNIQKKGIDPYPVKFDRSHTLAEAGQLKEKTKKVHIAGRIVFAREFGQIVFWKIRDYSGDFQLVLKSEKLNQADFDFWIQNIDPGDIIGASGEIIKTQTGEISLLADKITILSKSLRPLPDKWHGIKDEDELYRHRYLDFLLNPSSRDKVLMIPKIAAATRDFLTDEGFVEVLTPILENNPSGAAAAPFQTHLNAFDEDVYLRICLGELWQKKMMVGTFEKTFEIGRAFRNEGIDHSHSPEFNMCEYYWAYRSRDEQLQLFEKLYLHIIKEIKGTYKFEYHGKKLDFTPPFRRATFRELVLEETGIDIDKFSGVPELKKEIQKKTKVDVSKIEDYMLLLDELWKKTARGKIWNPVFVLDYPLTMKPLAKRNPDDPEKAHVFQLVIDGAEMCNAYSEVTSPLDQKARFDEQQKLKAREEAFGADQEFIEALEYGMPPVAGLGFGLDRLAVILTDAENIREITTFPYMRRGRKGATLDQKEKTSEKKDGVNVSPDFITDPAEKVDLPFSREDAMKVANKYAPETLTHLLAVAAAMRGLAEHFHRPEKEVDIWGYVGLFHDIDWDSIKSDSDEKPTGHCSTKMREILSEIQVPDEIIDAAAAHDHTQDFPRESTLRKSVYSVDELTGLIVAAAKVRPDKKLDGMKVSSVTKKMKDKAFAAAVRRDLIRECEPLLGIPLNDFVEITLESMKKIAPELEL